MYKDKYVVQHHEDLYDKKLKYIFILDSTYTVSGTCIVTLKEVPNSSVTSQ